MENKLENVQEDFDFVRSKIDLIQGDMEYVNGDIDSILKNMFKIEDDMYGNLLGTKESFDFIRDDIDYLERHTKTYMSKIKDNFLMKLIDIQDKINKNFKDQEEKIARFDEISQVYKKFINYFLSITIIILGFSYIYSQNF